MHTSRSAGICRDASRSDPTGIFFASAIGGRAPTTMTGTLLTMVVPPSVFLDDDIESLLGAHGRGSGGEWVGILLVPDPSWSIAELATAVRNVKKRAQAAAVVMAPSAVSARLEAMLCGCPEGGTIVLAWPGSAEEGLSLLRRLRQPSSDARTLALPSSPDEALVHTAPRS
jgi:hypothetical protein